MRRVWRQPNEQGCFICGAVGPCACSRVPDDIQDDAIEIDNRERRSEPTAALCRHPAEERRHPLGNAPLGGAQFLGDDLRDGGHPSR